MNQFVFSNFMVGELLDNILAATTEIRIAPTVAAKLQLFNPGDGYEARLTIWDGQEDPEIVGCVGNAQTGTLIVNRAQEGTTAVAWSAGAQIRCVLTAAVVNQALLTSVDTQALIAAQFLPLAGGIMTGAVYLPSADPVEVNEAAHKGYVDGVQGNKLPLTGGTMAGSINMNSNRLLALAAAVATTEPMRKAEADAATLVQTKLNADRAGSLSTAGTAAAYQVTSNTGYTALVDGMTIRVRVHATNEDSATLKLDTLTDKPIHRTPGVVVSAGDTLIGVPYDFVYSSSYDAWLISGTNREWETGDIKLTVRSSLGAGWRMMDDGTIGDATSGATYANANARALFKELWNSVSDTYAPVTGSRGASADADWAAHKKIGLTKVLGRALSGAGTGSGLSARSVGQTVGTETHTLTVAELAAHEHTITDPGHTHASSTASYIGGGGSVTGGASQPLNLTALSTTSATTGITSASAGSDTAHNNMQPTLFLNVGIHL